MPSKDTVPFKITINTKNALDRIRKVISKEIGICEDDITWKQAEIVFRIKANNGKITLKQINDVLLGKIK
jgi:hypothetical protein